MEWSVYGEWQTESYRPPQVENGGIFFKYKSKLFISYIVFIKI